MKIIKDKNYLLTIDLLGHSIIISEHLTEQDATLAKIEAERKILDLLVYKADTKREKLKHSLIEWAKTYTTPITARQMMRMVTENTNIWKSFREKHLDSILKEIKSEYGITIVENPVKSGNTKSWIVLDKHEPMS